MRGKIHERRHGSGELNPYGIVVLHRAMRRAHRTTLADDCGNVIEVSVQLGRSQEAGNRSEVSRRLTIKKHCGIGRERILSILLLKEAGNGEVIAKNARAALRSFYPLCDCCRCVIAFANRSKQIEL